MTPKGKQLRNIRTAFHVTVVNQPKLLPNHKKSKHGDESNRQTTDQFRITCSNLKCARLIDHFRILTAGLDLA